MPSRASARGCSGSTASPRSSNGRKEHDERHCEEAQAAKEPRIYRRGKSRDESARERAEGGRGRGKRGARRARRDGATRSRDREAATRARQGERPGPLAEDLVRNARVREQGRQGRLLLPQRHEVQGAVRDVRLQRQREARRRLHVAHRLRAEEADQGRRGQDREARQAGGELNDERDHSHHPERARGPGRADLRRAARAQVVTENAHHVFSVLTDPQVIPEWWGDGSVLEELPQVPGVAGSSVQGIVPRRFAAISLRSAGSQTRTVSAWASATSAVIAAGLGATTWWRSSRDALPRSLQARSQRRDFGVSPTLPTKDGAFTFRRLRPQALVRH